MSGAGPVEPESPAFGDGHGEEAEPKPELTPKPSRALICPCSVILGKFPVVLDCWCKCRMHASAGGFQPAATPHHAVPSTNRAPDMYGTTLCGRGIVSPTRFGLSGPCYLRVSVDGVQLVQRGRLGMIGQT